MTESAMKFVASLGPLQRRIFAELVTTADCFQDIALRLGTTEQVIKNYAFKLYIRSGCDSRAHLMLWAFSNGAVDCPCRATLTRETVDERIRERH